MNKFWPVVIALPWTVSNCFCRRNSHPSNPYTWCLSSSRNLTWTATLGKLWRPCRTVDCKRRCFPAKL